MSREIEIKSLGITGPRAGGQTIFAPVPVAFGATTVAFNLTPYIGKFVTVAAFNVAMHFAVAELSATLAALNPAFTGFGPNACVPILPGFLHRFMVRPKDNFIAATPSVAATTGTIVIWLSSERDGGVTVPYP